MAEAPHHGTGDQRELGALLVLLHGADAPRRNVHATYRIWHHDERAQAAFRADSEEQKRRGASISSIQLHGVASDEPGPPEHEHTVRIWRDGARVRVEHHGGQRDGYYAVASGPRWWIWDEHIGARSNQDDPSIGSGVGDELQIMLNPTPLLGSLRFYVNGSSRVAGRPTITANASPRPQDPRRGRSFELHELGTGADHYQLEIDQQFGVLLAVTAFRDEQPFHKITTLAIHVGEPIPAETFEFEPPEGEEIQTTRMSPRLQHVTLTEAQQRAPFSVLMPDRVPAGWQVRCTFLEASQRPPSPAQVSLSYTSDDGHQSISISQMAAAGRASNHYESMVNDEHWQELTLDGSLVRVRPAGWGQAQAHLERDGTFVFLVSDNLTRDQLAAIAARLVPAPDTVGI